MSILPDVLWLNVSPSLKIFDRSLLCYLSKKMVVGQWEYSQTQDEANSFEVALILLHDYLKSCAHPMHLIGHSTSGVLGLLYARLHPERVKSLTLLSVGANPAMDWQAFYYFYRQLLSCRRQLILTQMVYNLFGHQPRCKTEKLIKLLEQDLDEALSPHTLFQLERIAPTKVSVPMLVCSSKDDIIISSDKFQDWQHWLKEGDRLWQCAGGHHFFHYFYPQLVGEQILDFYAVLSTETVEPAALESFSASH